MKRLFLSCLVFICIISTHAQTGEIVAKVSGIDIKKGGELRIAMYTQEGYVDMNTRYAFKEVVVKTTTQEVVFKNIMPGVYVIAVYQDVNMDKELSKNIFGIPTELYGFSQNVYGKGGPPAFEEVSFQLNSGKRIILTIELK